MLERWAHIISEANRQQGRTGNQVILQEVVLEKGAISRVVAYLKQSGFEAPVIVADVNTYEAAAKQLENDFIAATGGVEPVLCLIQPNAQGDVTADEQSIVQLMLSLNPQQTDCIIAVGSGTIHDIARFVSYQTGKPFISVPTAPSVDGFTSVGAPIIVRGMKKTITAIAPIAIFADLDILQSAPKELIAAGFGDMLGKYTSLFDWKFSALTAGEPYHQEAADITRQALLACVDHVEAIGDGTEEGIRVLMSSLIESGLAMLLFGQSHPASAAEHHVSHYWEMEYIRQGKKQLLHGAKVGVACAEISHLYHLAVDEGIVPNGRIPEQLQKHKEQVSIWIQDLPSASRIREWLTRVGGPDQREQLGIEDDLYARSLQEAHTVRDRHTLLRALNEA